jgi:hypothetical protein
MNAEKLHEQVCENYDNLMELLEGLADNKDQTLEIQYKAFLACAIDSLADLKDALESNHPELKIPLTLDALMNYPFKFDKLPF